MNTELIKLASCHVTQHTNGSKVTEWSVEENITNEVLGTFPSHLTESEVFAILRIARKYELEALNAGIKFQKDKNNEYLTSQIHELKAIVRGLGMENEKLAEALDNTTKG